MTKVIALRLTLACDDAVRVEDLKPLIAEALSAKGTVVIGDPDEIGPRVHFGTVEVLQGPERVTARRNRAVAAKAPSDQREMLRQ